MRLCYFNVKVIEKAQALPKYDIEVHHPPTIATYTRKLVNMKHARLTKREKLTGLIGFAHLWFTTMPANALELKSLT